MIFGMRAACIAIFLLSLDGKASEFTAQAERYKQLQIEISQLSDVVARLEHEQFEEKNKALSKAKETVSQVYDTQLNALFKKQKIEIVDSMKHLEALIKLRPKDPSFTPNALFLLGERRFVLADLGEDSGGNQDFEPTIESYTRIVNEFPDFIYLDAVLYMLGICHDYMGNAEESLAYFQKLVASFPRSRFVPESTFRIGNGFFDQRQFRNAIAAYKSLATNPASAFHERALYKSAWSHYLLGEFQAAITAFVDVLDSRNSAPNEKRNSILEEEAKEYLAFSFVDLNLEQSDNGTEIVEHVAQFFAKRGKTIWEREVWLYLGGILVGLSRPQGAALAFERAVDLDENAADNVAIFSRIIAIHEDLKQKQRALRVRAQLVARLQNSTEANASILRDNLYALGLGYHSEAKQKVKLGKKDEAKSDYRRAAEFYARYIREFNQEANSDEVLYYLAETLFEVEDFKDSAARYTQVRDWPWPTSRRDDAALNSVYAWEQAIEQEQRAGRLPVFNLASASIGHQLEATTTLPSVLVDYVASIDSLAAQNPKSEWTAAFLFKAANLYLFYGRMDEASARLHRIISAYPRSQSAKLAATTLVNEKIARNDWPAVAKEAAEFASTIEGRQSEFRNIAFSARFKLANALFTEGKFDQASQIYKQLMQEDPKSEYADKILYNQSIALERIGKDSESETILQQLLQDYPASELGQNALLSKIKTYASQLKLKEAAARASQYVSLFPRSLNAPELMLDECFYLEANQEFKRAARSCEAFTDAYPTRGEALSALMKSAKLYARIGDKVNEKRLLNKILALGRSSIPQSPESFIEARFLLLESEFDSYERMRIDALLGKNQSTQLKNKTVRLADLKKKYEQIVVDGGPSRWSLASLQKIGALYEGLYRSLLDAPCPKDVARVDESACDEYQGLLEDKAFVLQQKSIESYELVLKQAVKINDSAQISERARAGLYRLQPDKYLPADPPIFVMTSSVKDGDEKKQFVLGEELMAQGRYEAARIFFEDRIVQNNLDLKAHLRRAQVLEKLNLEAASSTEYQKLLSLDQNNADAWDGLGSLAIKASDPETARDAFQKASDLNPSFPVYASHLANAYYMLSDWPKALAENKKAQALDPTLASLHFNLGLLYFAGKFDEIDDLMRLSLSKTEFEKYLASPHASEKKRAAALLVLVEQKLSIEKQRQERDKK